MKIHQADPVRATKALFSRAVQFEPYRAVDGSVDIESLHGNILAYKRQNPHSNNYQYYQDLLATLANADHIDVRPLRDLYCSSPDRAGVSLRHDIDIDPWCALSLSQALHKVGLSGTFYVLHTTQNYYGRLVPDEQRYVFERYRGLPDLLRRMQDDYGCEIGLHSDALKWYLEDGINGDQSIREELNWLRKHGINVVGTAAHNSAPVYGAENYEVFRHRAVLNRRILLRNELEVPLQTLDEAELGLTYEANYPDVGKTVRSLALSRFLSGHPFDAVRNESWMRTYLLQNPYAISGHDFNMWLIGSDRWAIAGHRERDPNFVWNATLSDLRDFLLQLRPGTRSVLHVHPIYIRRPEEEDLLEVVS